MGYRLPIGYNTLAAILHEISSHLLNIAFMYYVSDTAATRYIATP